MKLLIIIPYRDRKEHLDVLIPHVTQKLQKQNIQNFKIIVVEQNKEGLFNRGLLCNIGFQLYKDECDYFIFHDVDMVCEQIDYSYCDYPTSLLRQRSKNNFEQMYDDYFGGITLFPKHDFIYVNGFNNNYWGWGVEDDDLFYRCKIFGLKTFFKQGKCLDLENEIEDIKKENNPNYKNNLNLLLKLKQATNINEVKKYFLFNGLKQLERFYKINFTKQYQYYTLINVKVKNFASHMCDP